MKNTAQQKREAAIGVIKESARRWSAGYIVRDQIAEFTGGAYSSRYFANLDSRREGVQNSFKVGRRQCYPIESLVNFLISRLEV